VPGRDVIRPKFTRMHDGNLHVRFSFSPCARPPPQP
jgi:hypothetical protein